MRNATDLFEELNSVDESTRIEAKRASELGKSVMQTVIAFANEPGLEGGYLLLGADWFVNDKGDTVYRAAGLPDPDKVQRDLASQCASGLNVVLRPEMQTEIVDGKTVLVVYVPEADVTQKPVYLKATGLPRGAYRRIGSSDQHCVDEDLWVLRGESQPLHGPDSSILPDARLDDFDPAAVAAYRRERARINPQAEELDYGDEDLLEALGALRRVDGRLQPTLAGIVLFGKPLALRRLLPMVRIDYIRVPGNEWVEDPENRFQSIDIRKPLLLALPQAEASIIDELPKGFRLPEGQLHSVQEPILPRKVIREALANAAMHRSYTVHSPTQIIRYSNRIEIRNVGYSLKEPAQLGTPGSRLRNPAIAAVLHDLHLAEAKGTGIRAMRRLAAEAGLPLPEFHSDRQANEFRLTLFLHNLLTEDDHAWLRGFAGPAVSADEAKVLIYVRATGAVDNTACRDFCGLDTLAASLVLRRLRDRGLLEKQGAGSRTYYTLAASERQASVPPDQTELPLDVPPHADTLHSRSAEHATQTDEACNLELATLPPELATFLATLKGRTTEAALRDAICRLCDWKPLTVDQLATFLGKSRQYLRNKHLIPMVRDGELRFRYPESAKHPHQAYVTPKAGDL
ncbi:ATP-binding protein [Bordetella hinzii]|uniref:ATP-binding protein n=1 Tax=Bordetella hinzii TaxID=103855 RepID=UPI00123C3CF8|nr:ATP-binding protein [Bordetella hinzii]EKX7274553.1 putative DNA binding domain-containing protein [Pseudomonas aeruginosa]QET44693.1 ATP-dependent DNA helicase RecG [Bordetella hinzii]